MSRSTFRVLFYLKRNTPKKNGLVPVMCRITVNGKISQFSCKLDVEGKLWNVSLGRMSGRSIVARETNRMLDKIRIGINKAYQEIMAKSGTSYSEYIYGQFGVISPDARLQRPHFIGSSRSPWLVNEVLQTSETNSSVTYAGGVIRCDGQRTWNPVYKAFVGYNAAKTIAELNSAAIRNLNAAKVDVPVAASAQTIIGASVKKSDGKSIVIACPPGYKLTGIQNGLGANILGNFTVSGTVSVNCADNADAAKDYTVYIYPIGNGAVVEYKNVTIGKA